MDESTRLRIWWIPQVPMTTLFYVDVGSVCEGKRMMGVLADYDAFQFANKIKPDYCNAGGLQMWDGEEWVDWYDHETGSDDVDEYCEQMSETA